MDRSDIIANLRQDEVKYQPNPDYMNTRQSEITPGMREILVRNVLHACHIRMHATYAHAAGKLKHAEP